MSPTLPNCYAYGVLLLPTFDYVVVNDRINVLSHWLCCGLLGCPYFLAMEAYIAKNKAGKADKRHSLLSGKFKDKISFHWPDLLAPA
jgi:hypothetical protein